MSLKVLIVLDQAFNPDKGGVQRSTYKIAGFLKKRGYQTHVFSYHVKGHVKQDVAVLHHVDEDQRDKNDNNHIKLLNLIKDLRPDVVINQKPYSVKISNTLVQAKNNLTFLSISCLRNTLFTVILNIESYIKNSIPRHLQWFFKNNAGKLLMQSRHRWKHRKELKHILDSHDVFVLFGPPNIDELKYFVGNYKLHKTHLIPNSILSVCDRIPKKEKRILWLNRVSYRQKRAELIIPLWEKLMHQLKDWQFDVVGDGDALNSIKKEIAEKGLSRINVYGRQVPYNYYKRSSIYVMTSENEGFPNTLIEAQSFACIPVLFESYPIASWVLHDKSSGILIKPFDVEEMAKHIIKLANDKDRQKLMMNRALVNAREFEIDQVGEKWVSLFHQYINP